jgi:hypothetical protein
MIESNTAAPISTVVDGYFAMWNETDPARRRTVIAATWAPDAYYIDPLFTADGPEALDAMVAAAQEQFPGHRFQLTGAIDAHHDRARWNWELVGPDGTPVAAGLDVATLAPDGRLREITGFLHQPANA